MFKTRKVYGAATQKSRVKKIKQPLGSPFGLTMFKEEGVSSYSLDFLGS